MEVYHYTTEVGKTEIETTGVINQSVKEKRTHHGPGVYFTTLTPAAGATAIAINNWGRLYGTRMERDGRVKWGVKVIMPKNLLERIEVDDRDVLVHRGPVWLNKYSHAFIEVEDVE